MASTNFTTLTQKIGTGNLDFSANTFKMLLVSSVPSESNFDTWVNRSDVTNEVTGTGYSAGGTTVTATVSLDTTNNRYSVTYSNPSWASSTITAVGGIIYKSTGTSTTDTLCHFVDFSGTVISSGGTFAVTLSTPFYINR